MNLSVSLEPRLSVPDFVSQRMDFVNVVADVHVVEVIALPVTGVPCHVQAG